MSYLIDTDYVVEYLKGIPKTIEVINRLADQPLMISIVTYGEIYDGVIYGRDPKKHEWVFNNFLRGVDVLSMTRTIMKRFATIRGELRQQGLIYWRLRYPDCGNRAPR